jgi:hypothetical protein
MKALIHKDLRENLKVALIGLLILSLLLLQSYLSSLGMLANILRGSWSGQVSALQPLLANGTLTATAFFCAIFGAALGWLQARNEAHRDLWAFLIHRPITRTEIFLGKTIAGLVLYVFGAGLPLAVLLALVLTPGQVAAPFEWSMVLPLLFIFLTGVAYYFAGLLTALRQARWYASRSFGFGLAILASLGVFGFPVGLQLALIGMVVLILAVAAWGAYHSGGFYHSQPLTGKLSLTLAVAGGCAVVLFVGMALLFTLVINPLTSRSSDYSHYEMTRDGTIYKVTSHDNGMAEIVDLAGRPLLDPKTGQRIEFKDFQARLAYGGTVITGLKNHEVYWKSLQNGSHFFSILNISEKTLWYLDRHGNLIGFDGRTRKSIGSLNPHGADGTLASEPFLARPNTYYYYYSPYNDPSRKLLPTARTVYQVDFKEHTVKPVFNLTNDDEIGGYADGLRGYSYNEEQMNEILITTRKTVSLMDWDGKSIFTVPYKPVYQEYPQVQLRFLVPTTSLTNSFAVWFYPDGETNLAAHWKMPIHVLWVGPEQSVTNSIDLPSLQPSDDVYWPEQMVTTMLPPVLPVTFDHKINIAAILLSIAWAVICAVIGWMLAIRYNFSPRACVGWILFILLLVITGLLAFLCVQEWPAREVCPNCKKLRAVDRENCEHCKTPFSPPEKNGTEIFAPLIKG